MVHTGIYASSTECIFKMGNGYDSTNVDEDRINELCLQAESYINVLCRQVFAVDSAAFTALTAGKKYILSEAVSNLVGIYGVQYNLYGFSSTREAENIVNINWARFTQLIKLLQEQEAVTFSMKT